MKKKSFGILCLLCIIFLFNACKGTQNMYKYRDFAIGNNNSYRKIFDVEALAISDDIEDSAIETIRVSYLDHSKTPPTILSPAIKVVDIKGTEYSIKVNKKHKSFSEVYKQGVILRKEFKVYIGEIKTDDGKIIKIPPLIFKQYVHSDRINSVMDVLNQDTKENIFYGTVEEYKKGVWK